MQALFFFFFVYFSPNSGALPLTLPQSNKVVGCISGLGPVWSLRDLPVSPWVLLTNNMS